MTGKLNGSFKIVQASYHSPLVDQADVVLPSPIWAEQTGHVTNLEGKVFPVNAALTMPEMVKAEAEVLHRLADMV